MIDKQVPGSFRDPSGFLFYRDNQLYRQINNVYKNDYDHLMKSGLYQALADANSIVKHEETEYAPDSNSGYKIIKPEIIDFISYPYEWCFSQLKDAALATLSVQKLALSYGMYLKDASAYNIQFHDGKPLLIDTLSFEKYEEGKPWVAYKQFCQHFLAPLALMSFTDIRLNQLFRIYIDGIPLDLASTLLPRKTKLKPGLLTHIHFHAKSQARFADRQINIKKRKIGKMAFMGIIDNLESTVKRLVWYPTGTEWGDYYKDTNYTHDAQRQKRGFIEKFLEEVNPASVWDLGANTGVFSRIASAKGINTISFDIDPAAVEKNYIECRNNNETKILPLLLDLTNPSPGIGWQNEERDSLIKRGPTDVVMALALIHHLAISNNVPFGKIAEYLASICHALIIEFVPKTDSQVQRLLATRDDIFPDYTKDRFEEEFSILFSIMEIAMIPNSERVLYLMSKKL